MTLTSNYTCEVCWCVVLTKYRRKHEAWHARVTPPREGTPDAQRRL